MEFSMFVCPDTEPDVGEGAPNDIRAAVDYASRHPMARIGPVEVRPVMVWEG
jgi:hypothetical protein